MVQLAVQHHCLPKSSPGSPLLNLQPHHDQVGAKEVRLIERRSIQRWLLEWLLLLLYLSILALVQSLLDFRDDHHSSHCTTSRSFVSSG